MRSLGILEDEDRSRRNVMPMPRVVYSILSGRMHLLLFLLFILILSSIMLIL